jgi:hypothetical protein
MHTSFYKIFSLLLSVAVLAGAGLLTSRTGYPASEQETVTATPVPTESIQAHTVQPSFPLKITDISASPEPVIGQVVTVHVEIKSTEDEPDTTIRVYLPRGVKLVGGTEPYGGEAVWQGSLTANQPHTLQVAVCVLQEGSWPVRFSVVSRAPSGQIWDDSETIQLESTLESGRLIRARDFTIG